MAFAFDPITCTIAAGVLTALVTPRIAWARLGARYLAPILDKYDH